MNYTKITFSIFFSTIILTTNLQAQESTKKGYWKSGGELIFSGGDVGRSVIQKESTSEFDELESDMVVRFSAFFHLQSQFHYDFSESVGIYTGIGIRNIGWINKFSGSSTLGHSFRMKQRSYALGVPLALKLGQVSDGFYIAIGGEAELFFAYKQKVFVNDQKLKSSEWFSDKVNLFNGSVFIDIVGKEGGYIRFKYYLTDFLADDKQSFSFGENKYLLYFEKSQLFSISIGTAIPSSKYMKAATETIDRASIY
jgi:hypothetical protein